MHNETDLHKTLPMIFCIDKLHVANFPNVVGEWVFLWLPIMVLVDRLIGTNGWSTLWAGKCDSDEGNSWGEYQHYRKGIPRPSISGALQLPQLFLIVVFQIILGIFDLGFRGFQNHGKCNGVCLF